MALLRTSGLRKSFGAVTAAAGIDVGIEEGSVVGVIGSNGAGKTTFVNMVTGYVKPCAGRIHYRGRDITPLAPRAIARLGISRSFQIPQVFASVSALGNLLVALGIAGGGRLSVLRPLRRPALVEAARGVLGRYGLSAYADVPARALPQGVRKLLDIAMAAAGRPRLLLLDEPTSGVSADEKFGVMDTVMGALAKEGVTVVFVEHDMEVVARYAGRVLAFYDGAIIADGPPAHVLAHEGVRVHIVGGAAREAPGDGREGGRA